MAIETDASGQTVRTTCPYCHTKGVAITIYAVHYRAQIFTSPSYSQWGTSGKWDTFGICGLCERGVLVVFEESRKGDSDETWADFLRADPRLIGVFPSPPSFSAPAHTPDTVARFVKQAKASLPENCDAAGAMFRKALETALKDKLPGIDDKIPLRVRIKRAAAQQVLTQDLADWADQIALDGNSAAHDVEPFSREEAERLDAFTDLVLQYLYTLPGMLKEAQEKTKAS